MCTGKDVLASMHFPCRALFGDTDGIPPQCGYFCRRTCVDACPYMSNGLMFFWSGMAPQAVFGSFFEDSCCKARRCAILARSHVELCGPSLL
mmetsp:Transcript_11840/g.24561  ORF Transcript_11840/g.24561 Transcript_11840/m.24561 type:complete len:92 (-) Transcript_11840:45-320(-)